MQRLYSFLLFLILPVVLLRLYWRGRRSPAYRQRWKERLGFYKHRALSGGLWIHAVSVGEVQAAQFLIKGIQLQFPDLPIVITTTTPTGASRVQMLFGDEVTHLYTPYDLPWIVRRFLAHIQPRLAIVIETEIWPNLFCLCKQHDIPVILANARLSERSAKGYSRVGQLTSAALECVTVIAAQGQSDATRFLQLGARPEQVEVTGSIKFDIRLPASLHEQAAAIKRGWGEDRPVWVAASTHEGEEEQLLDAHRILLEAVPACLLVLVPRHPERFDRVAALIEQKGFSLVRRSDQSLCDHSIQVFLGDSMGELPMFLAGADVAFIGGSLVARGGHNLLEPAALGVATIYGPHMFNFAEITKMLTDAGAAVQVSSAVTLADLLKDWLTDASERSRIGENGRQVVEENRGALERLQDVINRFLSAD